MPAGLALDLLMALNIIRAVVLVMFFVLLFICMFMLWLSL